MNHISWDSEKKCLDFSKLSKDLITIFKNAGIKKKDLRNTDTAICIYEKLLV